MIDGARVFVVVPAFREAHHVAHVIRTMPPVVDHIIVVDDASDDGTSSVARACGDDRVSVQRHDNRGVGAAIVTGYRAALAMPGGPRDAFVVMAGDGQMDPSDLPALVAPIASGEGDYAKGTRVADVHRIPTSRYWGGRVMTALTRLALAVSVTDSQCGYTALSRSACELLDLQALWPRFGYPNDLLAHVVAAGASIVEVPVRAIYTERANKLRAWHVPMIVYVIARAWRRHRQ